MTVFPLAQAVDHFAQTLQTASDDDLERPWVWRDYAEGIRFACFRTFEELRELAVQLHQERQHLGQPVSSAQLILAGYHSAYRDLLGALVGLTGAVFEQPPAAGEWPLRKILAHILSADLGFAVVQRYTLERQQPAANLPPKLSVADWERISGLDEAAYTALMDSPAEQLLAYYAGLHQRNLAELASLSEADLDLPAWYWEKEPMSLRFRLQRFESHVRQHTIQVDKTLASIQPAPSEAKRLLRLVFLALADVENLRIGAPQLGETACAALAQRLHARADEISAILAS